MHVSNTIAFLVSLLLPGLDLTLLSIKHVSARYVLFFSFWRTLWAMKMNHPHCLSAVKIAFLGMDGNEWKCEKRI